uniref:Uncharacterized protein n=1 Tax=Meloidogyne floridensis TaxID=298350 RepID=A0A915NUT1_9BILA
MLGRTYDWVFGMLERGTNRVRLFHVADRTADTTIILILLLLYCLVSIIKAVYDKCKNNMGNANLQNNKGEYQRANVNYEKSAQPPGAPPPYPTPPEYPVHIGFRYPPA